MFVLALTLAVLLIAGVEGGCQERAANANSGMGAQQWFCDPDGSYSARQCVGSGCYCVDTDGNDLGHFTNYGSGAMDMDCNCARQGLNPLEC